MSPLILLFLTVLSKADSAASTNDVPYDRMPPLTSVDAYAPCLRARGDAYCFVSAKLSGDASHPLYSFLVEYSAHNFTHFNRTVVHRGICLKKTCQGFLTSPNVTIVLEACLNATLKRDFGLSATVYRRLCNEYRDGIQFDASDAAFGALVLGVVALNLFGTLYDIWDGRRQKTIGKFLSCFSVRRSWRRLMASNQPGESRLAGLIGHRIILSVGITFGHTGMSAYNAIENPEFIEESYKNVANMMLYRACEIIQVGFIVSALLLAYNVLKSEGFVTWRNIPKALMWRWLRFTPVYALVLFFVSTWARHVGEGPFWRAIIEVEANDCRNDWWLHLLYIHNYFDNSRCMLHSWYLAVDMQLTAVGVGIFFLMKNTKARKIAIGLLLLVGLATPPLAIYFKNLHPVVICSPEVILNWMVHDRTLNNLYRRGHTNLVSYALGLALGYVIYDLKDSDLRAGRYKKYPVLHWLLAPAVLSLLPLTGSTFYSAGAVWLPVRLFYTSAFKLVSSFIICFHVYLTIVNISGFRARLFLWRGWTPLARLTYCVYLIHMVVLRIRFGAVDKLVHASAYALFQNFAVITVISFVLALPMFLLVEAPFGQLTRLVFPLGRYEKH